MPKKRNLNNVVFQDFPNGRHRWSIVNSNGNNLGSDLDGDDIIWLNKELKDFGFRNIIFNKP